MSRIDRGLCVPPGVLHTPGGVGQTLSRGVGHRGTPWDTFPENPGNMRVSGVPFQPERWDTVGQQVSHSPKSRGTPRQFGDPDSPPELAWLDRLLTIYWADGVEQGEAARLAGMRKETFAEYADLRLGEAALERAAMRYYRAAFHRLFPRCNPAAVRQARFATRKAKPCRHDKEPTAREVALVTPPQRHTMRELVPSPRAADAEVAAYLAAHPIPLHRRFVEEVDDETGTGIGVSEVSYG